MKKAQKFVPPAPVAAPAVKDEASDDEIANAKRRASQNASRTGRRRLRMDLTRAPAAGAGVAIPK